MMTVGVASREARPSATVLPSAACCAGFVTPGSVLVEAAAGGNLEGVSAALFSS
jgi:hypothetical protein